MSNFSWIDGSIVGVYLLVTMIAGLSVRKYVGKVDQFLIAGREMDVYLGVASLAATEFGIVTCMSASQLGYDNGFAGATVGITYGAAMLLVGYTGFCVKPLRDSGVVTIAELFEKKYGPRIRWLSGLVIVLGGLLNMGVFLRQGGEFLVLVCGMSPGRLEITMTILLCGVAIYTMAGGMLSVLITDYLQFIVMSIGLLAVTFMLMIDIPWTTMVETVRNKYGDAGFNPLVNPRLGWSYIVYYSLLNVAVAITWQTTIARLLSAKDTKTGQRVYTATSFFFVCQFLIPAVWGIAALATLEPGVIPLDGNTAHAMPIFLSRTVPLGLMGLLVAGMLAADMSTDSAYMLTWGSVIYNDLLAPLRQGRWSEKRGLLWNRAIIALIGVFLLIYGLWYEIQGAIWDYLAVTGTIYLSSMATLLVACCYWPRANNWGATGAILIGAVFPLAYLVLQQLAATHDLAMSIGPYYSGIAAFVGAGAAMIVGSLVKDLVRGAPRLEGVD